VENMKKNLFVILAMSVMLFVIGVNHSFSASTVSFKESYADKIYTYREDGESYYEMEPTGKFAATFKLDLSSIFPATKTDNITKQFNGETCFDISVGAISEYFCLGDGGDVAYTPGKTSAQVTRKEDIGEEKVKWITTKKTTVKWTAKNIVTIKLSGNAAWVGWIMADQFAGDTDPAIMDYVSASVIISGTFVDKNGAELTDVYAGSELSVTGKATTKTVRKGRGDEQEEFELAKVTLSGKGEATISTDY
jgi:hypothetical protein